MEGTTSHSTPRGTQRQLIAPRDFLHRRCTCGRDRLGHHDILGKSRVNLVTEAGLRPARGRSALRSEASYGVLPPTTAARTVGSTLPAPQARRRDRARSRARAGSRHETWRRLHRDLPPREVSRPGSGGRAQPTGYSRDLVRRSVARRPPHRAACAVLENPTA